jgi:hypothetical protein
MNVSLEVQKPNGLTVNSQGRKPLVKTDQWPQSPNGATLCIVIASALSPRWGFQSSNSNQPGARAPGYLLSPPWGSI